MEDSLVIDLISAFLMPANVVWESEFGESLQVEPGAGRSQAFRDGDVVIKIPVSGSLSGVVYYGFGRALALSLAEKIQGKPVEEIDEMTLSLMEEAANMISGRTLIDLEARGYSCALSPPERADRSVIALAESADPSNVVHLSDDDHRAAIWADLASVDRCPGEPETDVPASPVDQDAIDALFAAAAG